MCYWHKVQTAISRVGSVWPARAVSRHLMPLWILSSSLARRLLLLLSVSLTSKPCWEHALGCPGGTWRPGAAANALPVTLIITTSRVRDTHFVASGGARRRTRRQRTAAATPQPLVASRAAIDAHALIDNEPGSNAPLPVVASRIAVIRTRHPSDTPIVSTVTQQRTAAARR
jgi:hypothetical protein